MNQSAERMPSGAMSDEPAGMGDARERRNPLLETALFKQVSEEQARELFDVLRHVDDEKMELAFVRFPSLDGVGMAVYNRLLRAAGFEVIDLEKN